jgi:L-methionine (R)-S-oxide reductase
MEDKSKLYKKSYSELADLIKYYSKEDPLSLVAKMSLISASINNVGGMNFVGFYVKKNEKFLEIGPYQSDILPCAIIEFGKGVCGTCWKDNRTVIVNDVSAIENYIACDDVTKSEIVLPCCDKDGNFIAVLDIDSPNLNNFNETDELFLRKFLDLLNI